MLWHLFAIPNFILFVLLAIKILLLEVTTFIFHQEYNKIIWVPPSDPSHRMDVIGDIFEKNL